MENNFKRFLSLLLALVMAIGLMPMGHVHAAVTVDGNTINMEVGDTHEIIVDDPSVTVTVGEEGIVTATKEQTAGYTVATTATQPDENGNLPDGKYVFLNRRMGTALESTLNGNQLWMAAYPATAEIWTVAKVDGGYTVQASNGQYLTVGDGTAGMSQDPVILTFTWNQGGSKDSAYADAWSFAVSGVGEYLCQFGGATVKVAAGYEQGDDQGAQWDLYAVTPAQEYTWTLDEQVTTIESGHYYIFENNAASSRSANLATSKWSDTSNGGGGSTLGLKLEGTKDSFTENNIWKITGTTDNWNVQDIFGWNLFIASGKAMVTPASHSTKIAQESNTAGKWQISVGGVHLNWWGGTNGDGVQIAGWQDVNDGNSQWNIYEVIPTPVNTTVTITAEKAGDTTVTVGDTVYTIHVSLLDVEPSNLAPGKTVTVSGTSDGNKDNVNDGNESTKWDSNAIKGSNAAENSWIYIDLGADVTSIFDATTIKYFNKIYPTIMSIQISNDAQNWTNISDLTSDHNGATNPVVTENYDKPYTARYVRLFFEELNSAAAGNGVGVKEWEINGIALSGVSLKSVSELADVTLEEGAELELPGFIEVVLTSNAAGDKTALVPVSWDLEGYAGAAGTYEITGTLDLPASVAADDKTVTVNVTVAGEEPHEHTPAAAVEENRVESTCTVAGSYESVVYCSECGEEISRETKALPLAAHTEGEVVVENNVPATCDKAGSYDNVVYCSVCDAELSRNTVTTDKLAHTPAAAVEENRVESTCTVAGSYDSVVYCSVCGEEISRETITLDLAAHTPAEAVKENEVAPTLNSAGSYDSVIYCSVCNTELSRDTVTVPALTGAVAEVGGTKYATLAAAVEAAQSGDSIALLADTTEDIVLDEAVTLYLNNNTLNGQILVKAAATVNNGTVYAANKDAIIIGVKDNANDASVSLTATSLTVTSETDCAVLIYDGTATFNNCSLNSNSTGYAAVQGSGNQFGDITLSGGTVTSKNEVAIYWPHVGTLTAKNNAVITGSTGLYIKQGTANLSGGSITGNGAYAAHTTNGNGGDSTGDAITVDTGATAPVVNLTGVTLNSTNSNLVGIYGGTVNQNGGLNATHDAFRIEAGTLNLNGGFVNAGECAVYIRGGEVNVKATSLKSTSTEYAAVQGNGNYGGNLTVGAGASITSENEVGIYWPGSGKLTVNGGVITGTTGIYAKQGNVTISGGTIKGTGAKADFNHNGNGGDATGDALVLESCSYGTLTAEITGGTFTSANANAVAAYAQNGYTALTGFVSGGTFSTKVEESYCAEGYIPTDADENGNYTVKVGTYVAQIGETKYETLQAAFNAAKDRDLIILLADVTLDAYLNVTTKGYVQLDLSGHNITRDSGTGIYVNDESTLLQITGNGTVTATQAVWANAGQVVIWNGAFHGYGDAIYTTGTGLIEIHGGTFSAEKSDHTGNTYCVLNQNDDARETSSIAVFGGTFVGFNPANNYSEGAGTNFVAEGYCSRETDGSWTVVKGHVNGNPVKENEGKFSYEEVVYCSFCGTELSRKTIEVTPALFEIAGATMTMGNTLDMNFFVNDADLEGFEGAYAVITKKFADGREAVVVTDAEWKTNAANPGKKYVKLSDLSAKEMTDEITVVIYNKNGDEISKVWTDSMRDYAMRLIEQQEKAATPNVEYLTFAVDMLNYGAAAQNTFGYNTTDLANKALSTAQQAYATAEVSLENNQVKDEKCVGATLLLQNSVQLNFVYKTSDITEGMYAVATYTNHRGEKKTVEIAYSEFGYVDAKQVYTYIPVADTAIADCRQVVTLTVYNSNGTVFSTVNDSVESYCARISTSDSLYTEIMKLADSAYALFH